MIHDPNAEQVPHKVQVARDGRPYTGTYIVEGETITVEYAGENKVAPLGGVEPTSLARMMLGEMVAARPPADEHGRDSAHQPIHPSWLIPREHVDLRLEEDEQHILQCLGASVLLQWNDLPNDVQRDLFETATSVMASDQSERVRQQLAVFLHDHKDDRVN
jgi:hypothetical protein